MGNGYKRYLLFTYLTFWVFIGMTGLVLMKLSDHSGIKAFMVMLCSWTPTFVLLIMFRMMLPDQSRKTFLGLFRIKILQTSTVSNRGTAGGFLYRSCSGIILSLQLRWVFGTR